MASAYRHSLPVSAPTMPSFDESPLRPRDERASYSYRRKLGVAELLPAIGIAIGAGFLAYYVTRILLQRTPLTVDRTLDSSRSAMVRGRRASRPAREIDRA
jgi:hypothetical protein